MALRPYVQTVAYCEIEPYCQAVLLERMQSGELDSAPIWDDVTTLNSEILDTDIDIICGGFPCQDVSVAGRQAGIAEGTRSGLFFHVMRLVREFRPSFVFLENVSAICNNGLDVVLKEIAAAGYHAQWCCLSAAEVGAPHKRNRWWLLAYADGTRLQRQRIAIRIYSQHASIDSISDHLWPAGKGEQHAHEPKRIVAYAKHPRRKPTKTEGSTDQAISDREKGQNRTSKLTRSCAPGLSPSEPYRPDAVPSQSCLEPGVGRNADGIPHRTHRIRALGNAVVPQAARKAFETLMLTQPTEELW